MRAIRADGQSIHILSKLSSWFSLARWKADQSTILDHASGGRSRPRRKRLPSRIKCYGLLLRVIWKMSTPRICQIQVQESLLLPPTPILYTQVYYHTAAPTSCAPTKLKSSFSFDGMYRMSNSLPRDDLPAVAGHRPELCISDPSPS